MCLYYIRDKRLGERGNGQGMRYWEKEGVRGQNGQRDERLGERGNEKGDWAGG